MITDLGETYAALGGHNEVDNICIPLHSLVRQSHKNVENICIFSLSRHRLGYLRTHDRLGGGESDPRYLENQWSYGAPRGGVRKLSTRPFQSTPNI